MNKTNKIFFGILLLCTSCLNREGNIIDANTGSSTERRADILGGEWAKRNH